MRCEFNVIVRVHPSLLLGTLKLHLSFLLLCLYLRESPPSILLPLVFLLFNLVIHPYHPPLLLISDPSQHLSLLPLALLEHPLRVPRLDGPVVALERRRVLQLLRPVPLIVEEIVVVVALIAHLLAVRDLHADHLLTVVVQLCLQMDVVLLLYIPEFSNALGTLFDFLLLHFSKLVFNLFLFALLSLLNVINERSFETEFKYLGLGPDNMVEFVQILFYFSPLFVIAFINNVIEVSISINLVNFHSSIFDDLREG